MRIDRTELLKNIVRGLLAFRELLATHPEWRERVVHLALAYPSRHDLPEYRAYTAEVMSILKAQPEAPEVCVERVKFLRLAEAQGRFGQTFETLNQALRLE